MGSKKLNTGGDELSMVAEHPYIYTYTPSMDVLDDDTILGPCPNS